MNLPGFILPTLFGSLITYIVTKLIGKTARLRYSTAVERIVLAADDPIFGSVRVTWRNGNINVRNLFLVTIEIENTSGRDFENVDFKVYCANDPFLLSEKSSVVDTPNIVKWSPTYSDSLKVPQGGNPTDAQWNIYYHSREYKQLLFNRGQHFHLTYLCTRPNDDAIPGVFIDMQLKGARLKHQVRTTLVHGVPLQIALVYGLIIAVIIAILCGYRLHSVWLASAICIFVGLFAQVFGVGAYKAQRWLWKQLAG